MSFSSVVILWMHLLRLKLQWTNEMGLYKSRRIYLWLIIYSMHGIWKVLDSCVIFYVDITQWKVTAGKCSTFNSLKRGSCCFETWDALIKKRFLLLFTVSKCCQNVWEVFPQKTLKQVKSWIYESIVAL